MSKKIKVFLCFSVMICLVVVGIYKVHEKKKTEEENKVIPYNDSVFEEAIRIQYTVKEASELEGIELIFQDKEWCEMTDLKKFPKLRAIKIYGGTTEKIEAISKIEGIEYLMLTNYEGTDATTIKNMKNLKCLDVIGSYEEWEFIGEMTQLETLTLNHISLPNLLFLKDLKNLTRLNLEYCDIERLNGLEKLPQLEYLRLFETPKEAALREYQKMGGLKNLKQLALYTCPLIEDLSFIAHLQRLELLTLVELGTTDISVLSDLSGFPNLGGIGLSDDIIDENQKLTQDIEGVLEKRGLDVTPDYKDSKRSHDPFW